jgi:hypothetical protein
LVKAVRVPAGLSAIGRIVISIVTIGRRRKSVDRSPGAVRGSEVSVAAEHVPQPMNFQIV